MAQSLADQFSCRLCLKRSYSASSLTPLFIRKRNPMRDIFVPSNLVTQIREAFRVEIFYDSKLPDKICNECSHVMGFIQRYQKEYLNNQRKVLDSHPHVLETIELIDVEAEEHDKMRGRSVTINNTQIEFLKDKLKPNVSLIKRLPLPKTIKQEIFDPEIDATDDGTNYWLQDCEVEFLDYSGESSSSKNKIVALPLPKNIKREPVDIPPEVIAEATTPKMKVITTRSVAKKPVNVRKTPIVRKNQNQATPVDKPFNPPASQPISTSSVNSSIDVPVDPLNDPLSSSLDDLMDIPLSKLIPNKDSTAKDCKVILEDIIKNGKYDMNLDGLSLLNNSSNVDKDGDTLMDLSQSIDESTPSRYVCKAFGCSKTYISVANLKRHLESKHKNDDRTYYKCPICSYENNDLTKVRGHIKRAHNSTADLPRKLKRSQ